MTNLRFTSSLVVAGCLFAAATAFGGGDSDFSSPACSTAETPAAPAKPQPGPSVEKEYYKKLNSRIDPKDLDDACGAKITTEYDKSWHGHWIDMGVGEPGIASSMQDNCMQLLSQVKGRCNKDAASKKSVAAKIKKIQCAYGSAEGTKVELKGTTLIGTIGPKACASDISDPANKLFDATL